MAFVTPPVWTVEELQAQRDAAEAIFRNQRREEGPAFFREVFEGYAPQIRGAFDLTNNLREITPAALLGTPWLWQILRYCCAPPISEEDLWTMVDKRFKNLPAELAEDVAITLSLLLDPIRFPWIEPARDPADSELEVALLSTTILAAAVNTATRRRGAASKRQEAAVAAVLEANDYVLDGSRTPIVVSDQLARGCFSKERKLAGAKCDVPVRLRDGRLLALECKVSNGPKNSWKRLVREVGGKAQRWREAFGTTQVGTGAVLAGVFDLSCVRNAQAEGVILFWEHDLGPLIRFLREAR